MVLSAGHLIQRKRHDRAIRAMAQVPDATLVIAGQGPKQAELRALASELGVANRVHFLGAVPHDGMAGVYNAADVLVLASEREGWPNVLLEAMACGTPVIAAGIWGVPEVVTDAAAGTILPEPTPSAIAAALTKMLDRPPRRRDTRAYAEQFSWAATTRGQLDLFRAVRDADV